MDSAPIWQIREVAETVVNGRYHTGKLRRVSRHASAGARTQGKFRVVAERPLGCWRTADSRPGAIPGRLLGPRCGAVSWPTFSTTDWIDMPRRRFVPYARRVEYAGNGRHHAALSRRPGAWLVSKLRDAGDWAFGAFAFAAS